MSRTWDVDGGWIGSGYLLILSPYIAAQQYGDDVSGQLL